MPKATVDDPLTLLEKARDFLADPNHWWKGDLHYGNRSCALGAIYRVAGEKAGICNPAPITATHLLTVEAQKCGWYGVPQFNDHLRTSHAQVLDLFDRTIDTVRKERGCA